MRVDRSRRVLKVKNHAVLFVQIAHELTHLRSQYAFHRPLLRRDDMNVDAARTQRRGDLETDEARTHHDRALCRCGLRNDGAAISERTQRVYVWQIHTR